MMSESQAWLHVAKRAQIDETGLCYQITMLCNNVSEDTKEKMRDRIFMLAKSLHHPRRTYLINNYLWPLTKEGYRRRTNWAKRQSLLSKNPKGKK